MTLVMLKGISGRDFGEMISKVSWKSDHLRFCLIMCNSPMS